MLAGRIGCLHVKQKARRQAPYGEDSSKDSSPLLTLAGLMAIN
jgi:hypothetical protein